MSKNNYLEKNKEINHQLMRP